MIYIKIHTRAGRECICPDVFEEENKDPTCYNIKAGVFSKPALASFRNWERCNPCVGTFPTDKSDGSHLSSGVEVADGIGFKVTLVLPAQHGCDDDDN